MMAESSYLLMTGPPALASISKGYQRSRASIITRFLSKTLEWFIIKNLRTVLNILSCCSCREVTGLNQVMSPLGARVTIAQPVAVASFKFLTCWGKSVVLQSVSL